MKIHEMGLTRDAWPHNGEELMDASAERQNKTFKENSNEMEGCNESRGKTFRSLVGSGCRRRRRSPADLHANTTLKLHEIEAVLEMWAMALWRCWKCGRWRCGGAGNVGDGVVAVLEM